MRGWILCRRLEWERGTVSGRVALLLRSAEVKPLFYRFVRLIVGFLFSSLSCAWREGRPTRDFALWRACRGDKREGNNCSIDPNKFPMTQVKALSCRVILELQTESLLRSWESRFSSAGLPYFFVIKLVGANKLAGWEVSHKELSPVDKYWAYSVETDIRWVLHQVLAWGQAYGDLESEKEQQRWEAKTTAPRIPVWSPTMVLTRRHLG